MALLCSAKPKNAKLGGRVTQGLELRTLDFGGGKPPGLEPQFAKNPPSRKSAVLGDLV